MKKYILFSLIILAALPAAAQFQPKHDVVKFHAFHLFGNTFKAGYEHFGKDFKNSLNLQAGYTGTNINTPRNGVEAEIQYRVYPVQNFSEAGEGERHSYYGVYFAPFAGYKYLARTENVWINNPWPDPSGSFEYGAYYNSYRFGTNFGVQIALFNNVFFDGSIGGGVKFGSKHAPLEPPQTNQWNWFNDNSVFEPGYTGVFPRFDFAIGFAF